MQRKLSENEFVVKRYKGEMDLLNQLWIEQGLMIEQLESESMEQEFDQLILEGKKYEDEMKEIKMKLTSCETEVLKCREEIGKLMNQIDGFPFDTYAANDKSMDEAALLEHLRVSIQNKTQEIEAQVSGHYRVELSLILLMDYHIRRQISVR